MKVTKDTLLKAGLAAALVLLYAILLIEFTRTTYFYQLYVTGGGAHVEYDKAVVKAITSQSIEKDNLTGDLKEGYQNLKVKILTGYRKGQVADVKNIINYQTNVVTKVGQTIVVDVDSASSSHFTVSVYSQNREPVVYILIFLFIAALCLIGGKRGLKSVLGIVITLANVFLLFIPMLYRGYPPVLSSAIVAVLTACACMLLLNGFSPKSAVSILGTVGGVAAAALAAGLFGMFLHVTGYSMNETDALIQISGQTKLQVGQLLFAGILIASLGAVMDLAISIATSVNEVYMTNTGLSRRQLFASGMNVGRDMMGTMSNTLILAFTGTSLNMLILLYAYGMDYYQLINSNLIVVELIQALTGGLAVVLTVPFVSLIAMWLIPRYAKQNTSLQTSPADHPGMDL